MLSDTNNLLERAYGDSLHISVGTAIPLEHLLSTDMAKGYTHIYMNLRTLYRNYHGAWPKDKLPALSKYIELFVEEINNIRSIVTESIVGELQPVMYLPTSKSIASIFPRAKIKYPTTNNQKTYETLEHATITKALTMLPKGTVHVFNVAINGNNSASLIITHLPADLLSHHSFRKLVLLESHTAALKVRSEWITKLTKNPIYRNIPFNKLSIQILGDNGNQFASMGHKLSTHLVELATTCNWHALTTVEKIKFDIRKLQDKFLAEIMLEMISVTVK